MKKLVSFTLCILLLSLTACSFPSFIKSSSADLAKDETGNNLKTITPADKQVADRNEISFDKPDKSVSTTSAREKTSESSISTVQGSDVKAASVKAASVDLSKDTGDRIPVTLYYQDAEGTLIPVTRRLAKQEGIAKAAVYGMIDNTINREELEYYGLYPVLPMGTEILGINIKDGTATVDFSSKFLNYKDGTAERNVITALVYTLTGFKTVDNVKILVNGYTQKTLKYNTDISGVLNRSNILLNSKKANVTPGMRKVDAYVFKRASADRSYILPVSAEQYIAKDEELPARILDLLGKDYSDSRLITLLPPKVKLLQSSMKGKVLTLNFSADIRNYGGTSREDGLLKQILYSMRQVKGVEKVRILIEGKEGTLPEGTDISRELELPQEINAVMK